jgi:TRAP-type mannitol/chloroaromatic compound transport system substrate-binding protein
MDRRTILQHSGMVGILAASVAPAVHAQATIRWRLASSYPRLLDILFGTGEVFAKAVHDMSGGKFQISVHPGGELMPASAVLDRVRSGAVEMGHATPADYYDKDPTFCLGSAIPYGMNARQMNAWLYEGNGSKLMRAFYANYGIVNFPGGNTGAQMGGWFHKEIKVLQDLKDLKFGLSPLAGRVLAPHGVVAHSVLDSQILQRFEQGALDAVQWGGPYDDAKLGLPKVAPLYYYPGWAGSTETEFLINDKAWQALSAEHKSIVEYASTHAKMTMTARYDAQNLSALKTIVGGGRKLMPFLPEIRRAVFKSARELYAGLSESNPEWRTVYTDYVKFQADQILWFRFAEGAFDGFFQQQKF